MQRETTKSGFADSVIAKQIRFLDSTGYNMPEDLNYIALKKRLENDDAYFKLWNRTMDLNMYGNWEKVDDSLAKIKSLKSIDCDAAYRFRYESSLSSCFTVITVYKKENNYHLNGVSYCRANHEAADTSVKIKRIDKEPGIEEWNRLKEKIAYCDFWALSPWQTSTYLDPSEWKVEGLDRISTSFNHDSLVYKFVERQSPGKTAFAAVGQYMLELAGMDFEPAF
jgi:hypothetical protein